MKLDRQNYKQRRDALLKQIGTDGLLIIPSASEKTRNHDCEYAFRQGSDFYYLTGFDEPEAVLVLAPGRKDGESILFCRRRDKVMEIWNGRRAGQQGAVDDYFMDQAFITDELERELPELLDGRSALFFTAGADPELDGKIWPVIKQLKMRAGQGRKAPETIADADCLLHAARMIKSDEELAIMRRSCAISAAAHMRAMKECRPGVMEYQLEAAIHHDFAMNGARFPAYATIVGGGENACILHYTNNSDELKDGDLVLIDAGSELDNYAADITRTFPVNGRFSQEQKTLYELVLKAQLAAIDAIRPGEPWASFHDAAVRVLTEGLVQLGLLAGDVDTLIKNNDFKEFYMHGTGHMLGMDVHDVSYFGREPREFRPGMVLTVEPGIYVSPDNTSVEERWRGIGIRIEDNVLVTEAGSEVLTSDAPKTVADIEALMAQPQN